MRPRLWLVLASLAVGCSGVDLQSGLEEKQANLAMVALDHAGIAAEKVREEGGRVPTYRLRVPSADAAQALKVLRSQELPRETPKGVLEVLGQPSLIPTATQERALHVSALGGELARTLETIDGVLAARVHLSLPDDNPLREAERRPHPSASVLIKARAGAPLAEDDVKRLVAGSIDGLDPAKVSVVVTVGLPAPPLQAVGLAAVGPFHVARSSRGPLLGTLVTALVAIIGLCVLLVVIALRGRGRRAAEAAYAPHDVVETPAARGTGVVSMATRGGPPR
ncbi:MAG: secretion protein [Deltaproteobacteria bacterium]|nr:secretion protein [Deltaproteobacteria bacterium]